MENKLTKFRFLISTNGDAQNSIATLLTHLIWQESSPESVTTRFREMFVDDRWRTLLLRCYFS